MGLQQHDSELLTRALQRERVAVCSGACPRVSQTARHTAEAWLSSSLADAATLHRSSRRLLRTKYIRTRADGDVSLCAYSSGGAVRWHCSKLADVTAASGT